MSEKGFFIKHWFPVIIWMAVIFTGSTDFFSARHTSRFIGPLLRWFAPAVSDETIRAVQTVVRKGGHVTEYAVLAMLLWRAMHEPSKDGERLWSWRDAAGAILGAAIYAATDEFHQSFIPSRDASVRDVLLDTLGATLGVLVLWRIRHWRKNWWRA